jgi:two-component system OmpR family response regulator
MMRLLVVEDDARLVRALRRGLTREGYEIDVARTGDEALSQAAAETYDAVLLDLMLPGTDGFSVCRALREKGDAVPVLMLTARTDVRDRIRGLDSGADDYLTKPFNFGELLARLRALMRRRPGDAQVIEVGDLVLDRVKREATRAGHDMELTPREFDVLEVLALRSGDAVTRAELLEAVWDEGFDESSNIVDVYVGYLRRKLESPSGARVIETVRGVGFRLRSE